MKATQCSVACGVLALVSMTACTSLQTVHVVADPAMANASVRVDVAPATAAIVAVPVGDYWQPGNATRSAAGAQTVQFGPGHAADQTVSVKAKGAKKVAVIADLPGSHADAPGEADPRRRLLPVSGKGVKKDARVQVSAGGLYVAPTL